LPGLGQRMIVMDERRMVKFVGVVTAVDEESYTYDVELRKSFDSIDPSNSRYSVQPQPPTYAPNVSAPPPPPGGRKVRRLT